MSFLASFNKNKTKQPTLKKGVPKTLPSSVTSQLDKFIQSLPQELPRNDVALATIKGGLMTILSDWKKDQQTDEDFQLLVIYTGTQRTLLKLFTKLIN
jgi:hypothetical protein